MRIGSLMAAILASACLPSSNRVLEPSTAEALRAVQETLVGDSLGINSRPRVPTVYQRVALGAGWVVDILEAESQVHDARPLWFVLSGPHSSARLMRTADSIGVAFQWWWPSDSNSLLRVCLVAAQIENGWTEVAPVLARATAPIGTRVLASADLAELAAPVIEVLTQESGRTQFWVVHHRGATRIDCSLTRSGSIGNRVLLASTSALSGLVYIP
jgi:hypothetical protein